MGPVIYKRLDKHGTEFAISAFPLGGYVSMITNKLIELEPEVKEELTPDQIKNTFVMVFKTYVSSICTHRFISHSPLL